MRFVARFAKKAPEGEFRRLLARLTLNGGAGGNNFAQAEFREDGLVGAQSADDYFELTITPNANYQLVFSDVSFRAAATGSSANRRFSVLFKRASDAVFTDAGASANLGQSIVNTGVTLSDDANLQNVQQARERRRSFPQRGGNQWSGWMACFFSF